MVCPECKGDAFNTGGPVDACKRCAEQAEAAYQADVVQRQLIERNSHGGQNPND